MGPPFISLAVWPVDRAWFVATESDVEWTFVTGQQSIIDRLIDASLLEAVPTAFNALHHAAEFS